MAADRPACATLVAVAPAGRSVASYTITRDMTTAGAVIGHIKMFLTHPL